MPEVALPISKAGYYDFDPDYLFDPAPLFDNNDSTWKLISSTENTTFTTRFNSTVANPVIRFKIRFEVKTTFDLDGDGTDEGTWPFRDPAVQISVSIANGDWDAGTDVYLDLNRAEYAPGVHEINLSLNRATLDSIIRFDGGTHYGQWVLSEDNPSIVTAQDFADALTAFTDVRIRGDVVFPPPSGYTGYWGMGVKFMEVQMYSGTGNDSPPTYGRGRVLVDPEAATLNERWRFADGRN